MSKAFSIVCVLLIELSFSFGQKTLEDFEGNLLFKESFYYFPLTRNTYDTVVTFSNYQVNKIIEIQQIIALSPNDSKEINYTPIILYTSRDAIRYKYADPLNIDSDTTDVKLFPLNYKDSVETVFCYKIIIDTILNRESNQIINFHTSCEGSNNEIKTYRTNDTIINFKDFKLDCYSFEQKSMVGRYKHKMFTRKIIVDKRTLIPIDIKEYNFQTTKGPRYRNIKQEDNLLTYHQKLINIE